ncbi:MAG: hypothetical protein ACM3X9_01995 [Bacillota bacterium]
MRQSKLLALIWVTIAFTLLIPTAALAVPSSDLPWDWVDLGYNGADYSIGFGARDPNLGEHIGLEAGAFFTGNSTSPGIDLLYFFDPSESFSLNIGLGAFSRDTGSTTEYGISYSGNLWFHLGNTVAGVGYHTQRGATLRCGLWF